MTQEFEENGEVEKSEKNEGEKEDRTISITAGGHKIEINNSIGLNPFELVKKLYQLRHDDSLSKEEKEVKFEDITKDYLR